MELFLGIHKLPDGFSDADAVKGFEEYKGSAKAKGLRPISAVYSLEKGFAHCLTEAPSAQEVKDAHSSVNIPLEDVVEIKQIN